MSKNIGQHLDRNRVAQLVFCTHLRKSAIVPDVAMMWKSVPHKSWLAILLVLMDGVEGAIS